MGADQFTVMLLENEETLTVAGSYGLHADKLTSFKLRMGEGISGIAAQTREPVYIWKTSQTLTASGAQKLEPIQSTGGKILRIDTSDDARGNAPWRR